MIRLLFQSLWALSWGALTPIVPKHPSIFAPSSTFGNPGQFRGSSITGAPGQFKSISQSGAPGIFKKEQ